MMSEKLALHNAYGFLVVYSDGRGENFLDLLDDCTAFEISAF